MRFVVPVACAVILCAMVAPAGVVPIDFGIAAAAQPNGDISDLDLNTDELGGSAPHTKNTARLIYSF